MHHLPPVVCVVVSFLFVSMSVDSLRSSPSRQPLDRTIEIPPINDPQSDTHMKSAHKSQEEEEQEAFIGATQLDIEEDKPASLSWSGRYLVQPLKTRVVTPLLNILKSGATPEGIALSFAFGITGGLFPVPVATTAICFVIGFIFKLNFAARNYTTRHTDTGRHKQQAGTHTTKTHQSTMPRVWS